VRDDPDSAVAKVAPARAGAPVLLSVVMPVHNALPYLDEAVRSIVEQSHRDFEFVIGDDASTDGSTEVLRAWEARDPRIRLIERRDNLGPSGSSNWVVEQARGRLIARMDADDIAHPDRLKRQLRVLAEHPDAVLTGSPPVGIDREGKLVRAQTRWMVERHGFNAPVAHGSIMYRREAFEKAGGYRAACAFWEDLDLYQRMAQQGRVLVLPDELYYYRFTDTSARLTADRERVEAAFRLMLRCRDSHSRGEDYTPLLEAGPSAAGDEPGAARIEPLVFLSFAVGPVWYGDSPHQFRSMLKRASFPRNRESAMVWLAVLWGSISPRSLRGFLRTRVWLHNRRKARLFPDGQVYEWFPRAPGREG
jgi:glycosyltransferase involved in cell wall biosynthesis